MTLVGALEAAGLRLNKSEFRALMETAAVTREGDGWDYNCFCELVLEAEAGGGLDQVEGTVVDDARTDAERFSISREIAEALKGSFGEIRSAFRAYDRDGNGVCSAEEFGELLKDLKGLRLHPKDATDIITYLDRDNNGVIQLREFEQSFTPDFLSIGDGAGAAVDCGIHDDDADDAAAAASSGGSTGRPSTAATQGQDAHADLPSAPVLTRSRSATVRAQKVYGHALMRVPDTRPSAARRSQNVTRAPVAVRPGGERASPRGNTKTSSGMPPGRFSSPSPFEAYSVGRRRKNPYGGFDSPRAMLPEPYRTPSRPHSAVESASRSASRSALSTSAYRPQSATPAFATPASAVRPTSARQMSEARRPASAASRPTSIARAERGPTRPSSANPGRSAVRARSAADWVDGSRRFHSPSPESASRLSPRARLLARSGFGGGPGRSADVSLPHSPRITEQVTRAKGAGAAPQELERILGAYRGGETATTATTASDGVFDCGPLVHADGVHLFDAKTAKNEIQRDELRRARMRRKADEAKASARSLLSRGRSSKAYTDAVMFLRQAALFYAEAGDLTEAETLKQPEAIVAEAAFHAGGAIERTVRAQLAGVGSLGVSGARTISPRRQSPSRNRSPRSTLAPAVDAEDGDFLSMELAAGMLAYRWAISNVPPGPDRARLVTDAEKSLRNLSLLSSRVAFARADLMIAEGECCAANGDFQGAAEIATRVGKLYQDIEHDPKWASMHEARAEARRRREQLADLAVFWENRRRLMAIKPAVISQRAAAAAACATATKAAAAAAAVAGDVKVDSFGRAPGRPRGPIPDSALRDLASAAESFAWVAAWVEANPDLQGLADWVPTPGCLIADRAEMERARLRCLCGVAEYNADAAVEALQKQAFDDEARLARDAGQLDKAASAATAAREALIHAIRALDASEETVPVDDPVKVECARRASLVGALTEDIVAKVSKARALFDVQSAAATRIIAAQKVAEAAAEALQASDLETASSCAMEALAVARHMLDEAKESGCDEADQMVGLGEDQKITAAKVLADAAATMALANHERARRLVAVLSFANSFKNLTRSAQILGEVSGLLNDAKSSLITVLRKFPATEGKEHALKSKSHISLAVVLKARKQQAELTKELSRLRAIQDTSEARQHLRVMVSERMEAAKTAMQLAQDAFEAGRRGTADNADEIASFNAARTHAKAAETALSWVVDAAGRKHKHNVSVAPSRWGRSNARSEAPEKDLFSQMMF